MRLTVRLSCVLMGLSLVQPWVVSALTINDLFDPSGAETDVWSASEMRTLTTNDIHLRTWTPGFSWVDGDGFVTNVLTASGMRVKVIAAEFSHGAFSAVHQDDLTSGQYTLTSVLQTNKMLVFLPEDYTNESSGNVALYSVHEASSLANLTNSLWAIHACATNEIPVAVDGCSMSNYENLGYSDQGKATTGTMLSVPHLTSETTTNALRAFWVYPLVRGRLVGLRALELVLGVERGTPNATNIATNVLLRGTSKQGLATWLAAMLDDRIRICYAGAMPLYDMLDDFSLYYEDWGYHDYGGTGSNFLYCSKSNSLAQQVAQDRTVMSEWGLCSPEANLDLTVAFFTAYSVSAQTGLLAHVVLAVDECDFAGRYPTGSEAPYSHDSQFPHGGQERFYQDSLYDSGFDRYRIVRHPQMEAIGGSVAGQYQDHGKRRYDAWMEGVRQLVDLDEGRWPWIVNAELLDRSGTNIVQVVADGSTNGLTAWLFFTRTTNRSAADDEHAAGPYLWQELSAPSTGASGVFERVVDVVPEYSYLWYAEIRRPVEGGRVLTAVTPVYGINLPGPHATGVSDLTINSDCRNDEGDYFYLWLQVDPTWRASSYERSLPGGGTWSLCQPIEVQVNFSLFAGGSVVTQDTWIALVEDDDKVSKGFWFDLGLGATGVYATVNENGWLPEYDYSNNDTSSSVE